MRRFILVMVLCYQIAGAQCLKGDCVGGTGTYDFGYAVYTGNFKDSKPHGRGLMDYGNGEKYEGTFLNGVENGEGILHKDGTSLNVHYRNGKLIQQEKVVIAGGNAQIVEGCRSGDCQNGPGGITYPSGNKYDGHFKNGLRHGNGNFTFKSGNSFIGTFQEDHPMEGIFYYKQESVQFTGKVNEDCTPRTGNYYYANTDATVTIQDGVITKIVNPKADMLREQINQSSAAQQHTCPRCNGKGISGYSRVSVTNTTENFGVDRYLNGRYTTSTRYGNTSFPDICTECGGKGIKSSE